MILLLAISISGGLTAQQSPVDWVRSNAIRLSTPEAGRGFADMQPLKRVIGSARIVALGEATHGSREFFQLKHRMLEFLASELGFTIFSIEANLPEAYRLNDYVLTGKGDPAQLLRGMYFWTWDTEEVLAMIRWMREFNASGRGPIQFTGFDMQFPNVAAENVRSFVTRLDADYAATVREAAVTATAVAAVPGRSFGVATGTFPVTIAAGKTVRFSAYIKTQGISTGYAGLWWRVDGAGGPLGFDNMRTRGARGSSDWRRYEIELRVDRNASNINFGLLMPGNGVAWFDHLRIELDGKPYYTDTAAFDLDFESATPRGFFTGGNGYRVALDSTVAHSGRQSLRMTRISPPATTRPAGAPNTKAAMLRWKEIVAHLEAGRPAYRARGAPDRDIDFAIQNARVVLQGLQMRAHEVNRDQSMADNVSWIANQNPNAKIVLWAHNGHVAKGGFAYESMGAALRRRFGAAMVVLGFAFNQGSFQAIPQGSGALKNFTVPPAPRGSLDGTLAAAGIPLFALDLRQAPAWFGKPRGSRQIGAVYPEGAPYAFLRNLRATEAYDVVLFVDKTTAARKNPGR
jgi:erythromycin esterase-like protein